MTQLSNWCAAQGCGGDFRCYDLQQWVWLRAFRYRARTGLSRTNEVFGPLVPRANTTSLSGRGAPRGAARLNCKDA
jgi:hypothetical protein